MTLRFDTLRRRRPETPGKRRDATAIADSLQAIVSRIVEQFDPEGIILFGSFARGDARVDSDIDLLIVAKDTDQRDESGWAGAKRELVEAIGREIKDAWSGVDVVVTRRQDLRRRGDLVGLVLRPALREGVVLYGAEDLKETWPVSERDVRDESLRWLAYAEEDLTMVGLALERTPPLVNSACFHAQQAVEKALKSVLIAEQVEFSRTHDLEGLRALVPAGWAIREIPADLDQLTKWVLAGRYPDSPDGPPVLAQAVSAAATARDAVEAVQTDLGNQYPQFHPGR